MMAHFKEDGTLNLNQFQLSILLQQFYFCKATKMRKLPKLTYMPYIKTHILYGFYAKLTFFSKFL